MLEKPNLTSADDGLHVSFLVTAAEKKQTLKECKRELRIYRFTMAALKSENRPYIMD